MSTGSFPHICYHLFPLCPHFPNTEHLLCLRCVLAGPLLVPAVPLLFPGPAEARLGRARTRLVPALRQLLARQARRSFLPSGQPRWQRFRFTPDPGCEGHRRTRGTRSLPSSSSASYSPFSSQLAEQSPWSHPSCKLTTPIGDPGARKPGVLMSLLKGSKKHLGRGLLMTAGNKNESCMKRVKELDVLDWKRITPKKSIHINPLHQKMASGYRHK